jgi:hypothetical protein
VIIGSADLVSRYTLWQNGDAFSTSGGARLGYSASCVRATAVRTGFSVKACTKKGHASCAMGMLNESREHNERKDCGYAEELEGHDSSAGFCKSNAAVYGNRSRD